MADTFTLTGKILFIGEEKHISEKFNTREFAIEEYHPQYPQKVLFQLVNKNCDLVLNRQIGDEVTVNFNIKGREWVSPNGEIKYFNTLEAWKIEDVKAE